MQTIAMAGFVSSPNTLRVLWHLSTHGRPQLYVTHAEYTLAGPLNPNIAETMWLAFKAAMDPATTAELASTYEMTGVEVLDIRGPSIPGISSTSAALVGTSANVGLPDQVSICVTLRTALTGRSHRGRVYTIGWTTASVDASGAIGAGSSTAAFQMVSSMFAGIQAGSALMAIRSPALPERPSKPGGTLPEKPFEITPVSLIEVRDAIFDTNRRRVDLLRR